MNKKFIYSGGMLLAGLLLTACSNGNWEDNLRDTIDQGGNNGKTSVYFAMQDPVQPIILGNDDESDNTDHNNHQFKLMATWGGGYENTKDCKIMYEIRPSLLEAGSGMEVLPSTHYTIEDPSVLTIPAGSIIGGTTVKLTEAFFNDAKAATNHYVLPIKLVESQTGDTILEDKSYQLLCVKYINQYAGLYCKTGTTVVQDLRTVTHKNEDTPLNNVTTVDIKTCQVTFTFPVKEWKWNEKDEKWEQVDATRDATFTLAFNGESTSTVQVLQDGVVKGTGSFEARGILDFSDYNRMADCLKIKFTTTVVTNAGDADHEKTWTISGDYVMSMMNRGVKLEHWQ
jgi:hypothetical protein